MKMVDCTVRVIDLWPQWNKVCKKYNLTYIVEDTLFDCAHGGGGVRTVAPTNPKNEKSYHLKPPMNLDKTVGYHDLITYLLQPNPTLLDTITSELTKAMWTKNKMTSETLCR